MSNFMNNFLSRTADGTTSGDLGLIPAGWHSETVYNPKFVNEGSGKEITVRENDGHMYISRIVEICKQEQIAAELYDMTGQFYLGSVSAH